MRETREETGLDVVVLEAWPSITHVYPERTVTLYPFLCRSCSGDALALESRQIVWAAPSDLSRYAFPEANRALVKRLQSDPRGFTG